MKYTLELDQSMYFTHNGMGCCVFIDDSDDGFDFSISWDELIDNEMEMQLIPDDNSDVLTLDGAQEIYDLIISLDGATKKLRERLESCLILDRQAWIESNDGKFDPTNRDQFLKYFSYDFVEPAEEEKELPDNIIVDTDSDDGAWNEYIEQMRRYIKVIDFDEIQSNKK